MTEVDRKLNRIVFKACLVAVWTDSSMSADEHRYLSHLIEILADSEEERNALKKLRLQEPNEAQVLAEVAELQRKEKAYVLDSCLDILMSDRIVDSHELEFLSKLRKICGIGYWAYQRKFGKAQSSSKAQVQSVKKAILIRLFIFVIVMAGLLYVKHRINIYFDHQANIQMVIISPSESLTGKEISVSILEPTDAENTILQTGEEVFERVQSSIVWVKVLLNNDPISGGSGFVIGTDETGLVYVVTNKHVINDESPQLGDQGDRIRFEVGQYSGAHFDAKLEFFSRKHDIALLTVKGMEQHTAQLKLILKDQLRVGQSVYAVGTPLGYEHSFTAGIISALREARLQTDVTVHFGSSGGPLVDQHGALCGVVTSGHSTKNFNFALYANIVLEVLEERRARTMRPPIPSGANTGQSEVQVDDPATSNVITSGSVSQSDGG